MIDGACQEADHLPAFGEVEAQVYKVHQGHAAAEGCRFPSNCMKITDEQTL